MRNLHPCDNSSLLWTCNWESVSQQIIRMHDCVVVFSDISFSSFFITVLLVRLHPLSPQYFLGVLSSPSGLIHQRWWEQRQSELKHLYISHLPLFSSCHIFSVFSITHTFYHSPFGVLHNVIFLHIFYGVWCHPASDCNNTVRSLEMKCEEIWKSSRKWHKSQPRPKNKPVSVQVQGHCDPFWELLLWHHIVFCSLFHIVIVLRT